MGKKTSNRIHRPYLPPFFSGTSGFTIIEIIMVIVLLGIITTVAGMLIFQGSKSYWTEEIRKDITTQGRYAVERMAREIRNIDCVVSGNNCRPTAATITSFTASELRFFNTGKLGRGFRLNSTNLELCRNSTSCATADVLASNVSSLSFQYLDKDGNTTATVGSIWSIVASLTLTRENQSVDFRIQIHPRAFKK